MIRSEINLLRHSDSAAFVAPPSAFPLLPKLDSFAVHPQYIDDNPIVKSLVQRAESARLNTQYSSRNRYPDFVAQVAYFGNRDPNEKRFQVGVGVELPFDQSRRRAGVSSAEYREKAVHKELAHTRVELEVEISKRLSRIRQQRHIIHLYNQRLSVLVNQSRSAALADYTNGKSDFHAVVNATRHTFDVSLTLARAKADLFIAVAALEKAVGESALATGGTP